MTKRQIIQFALVALFSTSLIAILFGFIALRIREHVLFIWSLFIGFSLAIIIFHFVAWLFRGKITKDHIQIIDYVYLSITAIGLCAISTLDAQIAKWQAEESSYFLNATHLRAISKIEWAKEYYKQWPPDLYFDGYSAKDILQWVTTTRSLLAKPYKKEQWDKHIHDSRNRFRHKPPYDIEYVLSEMVVYQDTNAEQQKKQATAENSWYFYVRHFGFWAIALALALRILKVSTGTMGWLKTE